MARLEYTLRELSAEGYDPATIVDLAGSVDPDTLEIFEEMMDKLIDGGHYRVIFNLEKLKYINSTGMGMSVQFADQLTEENGGLVFMKVPPKVLLVIEMLGLQELFQIVSTEEQALAALAGSDVGPASIEVKLEDTEQPDIPEPVAVESTEEAPEPEEPHFEGGGTPQVLGCPVCGAQLSIGGRGAYRCPRCRSTFEADDDGNAQGYAESVGQVAELSLPVDEGYFTGASWMINLAGLRAGLDEARAQAAATSAEGCLKLLAEQALNGSGENERLHLFVRGEQRRLSVRIYCGGRALASRDAVDEHRGSVDRLEYMASPEGNLITLEQS